jgi:hypothetical protein
MASRYRVRHRHSGHERRIQIAGPVRGPGANCRKRAALRLTVAARFNRGTSRRRCGDRARWRVARHHQRNQRRVGSYAGGVAAEATRASDAVLVVLLVVALIIILLCAAEVRDWRGQRSRMARTRAAIAQSYMFKATTRQSWRNSPNGSESFQYDLVGRIAKQVAGGAALIGLLALVALVWR